ncbi:DUF4347 domain-containing protein [Asaia sp. As-1742]|uniref:DUF4347 domain-containing protein n=1 Tax=Asaia sp. As-1742 TaxID=2608325 RepID=UPI0014215FF0|nr:DUF4347 domain-containing protein [Asaia sp. As-1742]
MRRILEPRRVFEGQNLHHDHSSAPVTEHHDTSGHASIGAERASAQTASASQSIAFIDTGVSNWQMLADALPSGTKVIKIAPGSDALKQITDVILKSDNLDTVSVISYGSEGKMSLGSGLDNAALEANKDQIASWSGHFAKDGQILLWACDTGEGSAGQSLVTSLHDLTHTDVAASSNPIGSSAEGGDWTLESKSGDFSVHDVFGTSGVSAYQTVLDQAQPTVALSHEDGIVPVGSTFAETISFSNAATNAVGYGPYIAVLVPKDTGHSASLSSLTYLGNALSTDTTTISSTLAGHQDQLGVLNPYARDGSGNAMFVEAPSGASAGDQLVFAKLPFGSYSPGQPAAQVQANFSVDSSTTVGSSILPVSAFGGFYLGQDALNNPSVDAPITGTVVSDPRDTSLVTVKTTSKTTTATDNSETATGSDFPITYTTTITPAPATTSNNTPITNFETTITLPSNTIYVPGSQTPQLVYADGTPVNGAQVTLVSSNNGYGATFSVKIPSLDASHAQNGVSNVSVALEAYVPQSNADGSSVLGNSGASAKVAAPTVTYSADNWLSGNGSSIAVSGNGDTSEAVVTAKSVALQNSAQDITTSSLTGTGYVLPNDTIRYTAAIQTSDYNALSKPVITQTIDDGQTIDPTSSPVFTYSVKGGATQTLNLGTITNASTQTINGDLVNVSGSNSLWSFMRDSQTGRTTATFNVGDAIQSGILPAGAVGSLTYQARALTHYSNGTTSTGTLLTEADTLTGSDTVQGGYASADGTLPSGSGAQIGDGGQTGLSVPDGTATIQVTETTQTDANGNFRFYGLPNGTVTITAPQTAGNATSSGNLPAYETNIYVTSGTAGSATSQQTANGGTLPDVEIVYRLPDQAPVISGADQSTVLTQNAGTPGSLFHTATGATSAVAVSDAELDKLIAADPTTYSYGGSVLTIQRYSDSTPAPVASDVFGGQNGLSLSNGNVTLSGTQIGTYTLQNGALALTFASQTTSQTVTSVLRNLTYTNLTTTSDQVQTKLGITIDDHNNTTDNAQGTGGKQTSTPVFTYFNTVATQTSAVTFNEPNNSDPSAVASRLALPSLSGNATISQIALAITGNPAFGQDQLVFTGNANTGNITGAFDATRDTLTLSSAGGTATQAQWNSAVAALSYYDSSDTPSTATRTLTRTTTLTNGNILTQIGAVTVAVVAHDDSPVLDITKPVALVSVSEDQSATPGIPTGAVGTLVSALINAQTVSDPDANNTHDGAASALLGMVVTNASTQFGNWYYTTDNGAHWQAFNTTETNTVSSTKGLFLVADAQTRVAFVPTTQNFNGSIPNALAYRAWDQYDAHANGSIASLPTGGSFGSGTDAAASYSSAVQTLPQTVIALNNAPVAGGTTSLGGGTEDQASPVKSVAQLFGANFDDKADAQQTNSNPTGSVANTLAGVALVSNPTPASEGHWSYSTDGGKRWISIPTNLSETNALILGSNVLLTYQAAPDFNGAPAPLNAHLIDSSTQIPVYGVVTGQTLSGSTVAQSSIDISANQGGDSAISTGTVPLSTTVAAVNDAPVVIGTAVLTNGTEDTGPAATGQTIGSLFDTKFSDAADQQQTAANPTGSVANTLAGIAITANTTPASEGQWVYSTDNGKTWQSVGSVSDSSALVLSRDVLLSFSPAPNFNGQPAPLGERLIDSSAVPVFGTTTGAMIAQGGIVQQGVDVTSNGGTTAVSANQSSLGVTVAPVNDAPVASQQPASLPPSTENGPVVSESVLTLFSDNFSDSADQQQSTANPTGSVANVLAGIAITGNTTPAAEGAWRYSTDGGQSWTAIGTVSTQSALVLNANALLTFTPAKNFNGVPAPLTAHLIDSSTVPVFGTTTGAAIAQNNIALSGVDVTSNGGTTAISLDSVDLNTSVTATHTSPKVTSDVALGAGTEDAGPIAGKSVEALFSSSFDSSADRQRTPQNPTGSVESNLAGIVVTGNPTSPAEGVWRYSTDGGTTWNTIGQVSSGNALVLGKNALLDFSPAPNFNGAPVPLQAHLVDDSTEQATTTLTGAAIALLNTARFDSVPQFGGESAVSADIVGIQTTITAVNDAPVATGSASLPAGTEDQTPPAQSVATLFGGSFNDSTDQQQNVANPTGSVANTLAGIAVTANTTPASEGVWRYSTDGGKTWTAIGTVSDSAALVLSADTLLSFAPAPNFNGAPPPLSAHLIDSSTVPVFGTTTGAMIAQGGIAQQGVDVTSNGGTTALSANSVDLNTTVTAVNDAPVATGSASLPAGTEDQTPPAQSVATLFGGSFNDSTDQQQNVANPTGSVANTLAGIAVTANTTPASEGVWRYSTDGGKTWTAIGTVSDSAALVLSADTLLSFAPAPNFNGAPPPLSAHLIDSSTVPVFGTTTGAMIAQGGIAQQGVDVTSNGGTTALSANSVDLNTTVTAVPDAPTATGTAFLPSIVQDGAPHGETVGALFGPGYGNAVDQQQTSINPTGSIAVPIAGVAIVSNPTPTSEGSWVYSTDGGQHWITISPSIDPAHALVLPKDVLLAFYPAPDFNGAPLPLDGRPIATNDAPITPGFTGNALHAVVQNVDLSNPDPNGAVALSAIPLNTTVEASLLRPQLTPGDNSIPVSDNGETVRDLFVGRYTDYRRDQQSALNPTGSTGAPFGGIVITANPTPPSEGTWRYSTDNGKSWVVIPTDVSPQHAFVVPAEAQIMFQGSGSYTGSSTLEARLLRQNGAQGGFVDTGSGPFGQTSAQTLTLIGNTVAQDIGARFGLPRLTTDTLREGFSASALAEPVVQAWLGPYERNVPQDASLGWLRGTDSQAFVMIQTQDAVSIASAFDNSDPVASLVLRATQKDGAPLPDWIVFDPLTGSFTVIAPAEAPEYVDLRVKARDQSLRTAESNIRITIGRDPMLELLGSVPDLATRAIAASGYSHGHRPFHRQVQHVVSGARPIPNRATKPRAHS